MSSCVNPRNLIPVWNGAWETRLTLSPWRWAQDTAQIPQMIIKSLYIKSTGRTDLLSLPLQGLHLSSRASLNTTVVQSQRPSPVLLSTPPAPRPRRPRKSHFLSGRVPRRLRGQALALWSARADAHVFIKTVKHCMGPFTTTHEHRLGEEQGAFARLVLLIHLLRISVEERQGATTVTVNFKTLMTVP
ncbi:hypothetical protein DPEC_G00234510 [Dallia pectoralis]|uniref:Uncharacterized protein n=1 Tax=Dallia pectoralis TaxID=75939 RepID=A0ACC2FXW7_DALPE|nr:hypothetical protein DPEC_G00234510 [Dallia pectoralis]